jgi:hypothetical protein
MNKKQLLSLANTCGGVPELTKKIKNKEGKATRAEAAAYLETLMTEYKLKSTHLIDAFDPQKRADFLTKRNTK